MQNQQRRIPDSEIAAAGGDWAGYGELTGPQVLDLLSKDKLRLLFANNGLIWSIQRADGAVGDYQVLHTPFAVQPLATPADLPYTAEKIREAAGNPPLANVQLCWPILYRTMVKYSLHTKNNIAGMVGTIAKEAGVFLPVREAYYIYDADPAKAEVLFKQNPTPAYNWYTDTTQHAAYGGGPDYHGRGFVQTTHIGNYQKVQDRSGLSVVAQPDLLLTPEPAAHAICIFWLDNGLAALCEQRQWNAVRSVVWGGNDPDGVAKLEHAARVLL